MEIIIPLHLLFAIFGEGVSYMKDGVVDNDDNAKKMLELEIPKPDHPKRGSICKSFKNTVLEKDKLLNTANLIFKYYCIRLYFIFSQQNLI